jgi:RNA polymerase sigma factor (sigma-70 family)
MAEDGRIDWADLDSDTREAAIGRLMHRTGISRLQAEDAVSEGVVRLMRLRPIVRDPTELLTVTALNHFRGEWTRLASRGHRRAMSHSLDDPDHVDTVELLADQEPDPATAAAADDERTMRSAEVRVAIEKLPPMDRSVLEARYFEGRAPHEIDEARGDKPGTARSRIGRARKRLKRMLQGEEAFQGRSR